MKLICNSCFVAYKKSFMRKKLLDNPELAKISRNADLFRTEVHYYKNLAPILGPFGPDCILAEPNEIIMEDLGKRNFRICEKREQLNLDHCMAVVQVIF